jgi:hypothetical protein
MHLFKNKTKDVKQFLEEMKANKTNRSSNTNTLEKKQTKPYTTSPEPYHSQYISNPIGNPRAPGYDMSHRNGSSAISNQDSNSSFRGSVVSNPRSINSVGHNFTLPNPQLTISHHHQRVSQEPNFYKDKSSRPIYNERPDYQDSQRFAFEPVSEPIYSDFS